ncbi:MAG: NAD(P)H-hydrate dehydratase [Longimicrobiaceae bacterium]
MTARSRAPALTPARMRALPLPRPDEGGDKEERGRVLVAGGERENPGALLLAGTAALRAGAGKLRLAAPASIAVPLGVALPEARVFALAETKGGAVSPRAAKELAELAGEVDAFLLGPGMIDPESATPLTRGVLERVEGPAVVLDAGCFTCLAEGRDALHRLEGRAVITPHAGEMARILGMEEDEVSADPLAVARRAADELGAVVALKGAVTFVAAPGGEAYRYERGRVGLATSGSGDALAGIVAGLLARGADPLRAAAWAVWLHGEAGNALTGRVGRVGFLARELLDEIPAIMDGVG